MASLQQVLVFALSTLSRVTWAKDTDGLTIVGGHNVSITDAPYMAALYGRDQFVCGGSIIHERFILTAAHCVRKARHPRKVSIGAASLDAEDKVNIGVQKALCHKDYHPDPETNDICLLKLQKPVPFSPRIATIGLPTPDFHDDGNLLVNITGWGITKSLQRAKILQQVTTVTVSDQRCRFTFPDLKDTMMCAGTQGRDACQGDSGGPLTHKDVQIGVVSYGKGCGRGAGVFTKVSAFLNWIKDTIAANP